MALSLISAPSSTEYAPFYAGYISAVADQDVAALLHTQVAQIRARCANLTDAQAHFRYAPGKWSIKEVLGHLGDAERVFAYRLFRISRGDETPLPGFDENHYVAAANADTRSAADLLDEFAALRAVTLHLVATLNDQDLIRQTVASGKPISARAQLHIIAGHVQHHLTILTERYHV